MAKQSKQYILVIEKHGKNRYKLEATEGNTLVSCHSYNDMTQCELAKIVLESKGYKQAAVKRASQFPSTLYESIAMQHVGPHMPIRHFEDAHELIGEFLQHPEIVSAFVAYSMSPDVVVSLLSAFMNCVTLHDAKTYMLL